MVHETWQLHFASASISLACCSEQPFFLSTIRTTASLTRTSLRYVNLHQQRKRYFVIYRCVTWYSGTCTSVLHCNNSSQHVYRNEQQTECIFPPPTPPTLKSQVWDYKPHKATHFVASHQSTTCKTIHTSNINIDHHSAECAHQWIIMHHEHFWVYQNLAIIASWLTVQKLHLWHWYDCSYFPVCFLSIYKLICDPISNMSSYGVNIHTNAYVSMSACT